MTEESQAVETAPQETRASDKELNFRQLEAKFQRQLDEERKERLRLEEELKASRQQAIPDDDDEDVYIDKKRLQRHLSSFGENTRKQTKQEIDNAVNSALEKERQQHWIKSNPDFYDTIEKHANELAQRDPELAEAILKMPNEFERQKLAYRTIKSMGLDKPKQDDVQQKINQNLRGPYYQPTGVGSSPYMSQADFSQMGQEKAYQKMQELKRNLRLG